MTGGDSLVAAPIVALVPTLGAFPRLAACVRSLLGSSGSEDLEILVVVNGGDGHRPPERDGRVVTVRTGVNLGWAGGLTFGRRLVDAEYLWVVQDDMTILPGCLEGLRSAMQADPGLGGVRPMMVDDKGRVARRSGGGYLDDGGHVVRGWPMRSRRLDRLRVPDDLDYIAGSGMLIRSEAWDAAGGWDWRYYPVQYADIDFTQRLRSTGWRVALTASALARHAGSGSTGSTLRHFLAFHNRRRYEHRWLLDGKDPEGAPDAVARVHPDISVEHVADLLALSNDALRDLDAWARTQHVARPVSSRARGAYWRAWAYLDASL
ncbi:MAG: glycosyltransferase [Actinomycetales bacterium]|nr:glycosyltransferase [Actinomycetales bacterium]